MITLIAHFMLPKGHHLSPLALRSRWGMIAGLTGVILNLFLTAIKLFAGLLSGSMAITADALNNLSDAASSIITLIGFRVSGHKADAEHPFGHGRVEYLAGFVVSLLIMLMAIELFRDSITGLFREQNLAFSPLILMILLLSILVKLYMAYYNHKIGQSSHSVAIAAAAKDSLFDALSTSLVLLSTLLAHFTGFGKIDVFMGFILACLIAKAGIDSIKDSSNPLLGEAPDPQMVEEIEKIVFSYDFILGMHDLLIHSYGPGRYYISLHVEVDGSAQLRYIHNQVDQIEEEIRRCFDCDTTVHLDPV